MTDAPGGGNGYTHITDNARCKVSSSAIIIESRYASDTYDDCIAIRSVETARAFCELLETVDNRIATDEEDTVRKTHWGFVNRTSPSSETIEVDINTSNFLAILDSEPSYGYPAPIWIDDRDQIDELLHTCEAWADGREE